MSWPNRMWCSYLCSPVYLGWQACVMAPSHWLRWGLVNFFFSPRLDSNCNSPDLCLSSS
jgi:hypothetical protein